jgi:NTE family protein
MNILPRAEFADIERRKTPRFRCSSHCLARASRPPDQVVTVVSVSAEAPHLLIAKSLAQTLQVETDKSVLLLHLAVSPEKLSLRDWAILKDQVNGEFGLRDHLQPLGQGVRQLTVYMKEGPLEAGHLLSLIDHCKGHFHYVILHLGMDMELPLVLDCVKQSDRTFVLVQPTIKDLYHRDLLQREIRSKLDHGTLNLKTIVCREKGEAHFNKLLKRMGTAVDGFVHGCPGTVEAERISTWQEPQFQGDIRRLAREIGHCRVGLALSSGGARGLAHIGVIQILEEHGVKIDVVAGCSMGAYVGAVWAFGYDGAFMEKLAREVEHRWGLLELLDPFFLPRQGFLRGEKVKRRLKRSIGDVHFSELARPLKIVATNLSTLERAVFASGEVAEAVHASSAIPGACAPVTIDGELYMDGGICDPLPVDVLEESGIERIIAVNTIPTPSYLRFGEEIRRAAEERRVRRAKGIKAFLTKHFNYFAPGNILDIIFRSFHGAQIRVAEESCSHADLVLRPLSMDGRWHDFRRPGKYIAIGRRETEEHIGEIKALVNRKEPSHESEHADKSVAATT